MNNATYTSLSSTPLLSICHYISAFSIFFTSINLMTIDDENQFIPVINALFEYLNTSTNESEAKVQLLQKVLSESNVYQEDKSTTIDAKYANEKYEYIINVGLFHTYGNITEYLSGIRNRAEKSSLNFKKLLQKDLFEYNDNKLCSSRNRSTKLTPLAIEKLLDRIWYSGQRRNDEVISNAKVKRQLRFKRQPPEYININNVSQSENKTIPDLLFDDEAILAANADSMDGLPVDGLISFVNSDIENDRSFSNILEGTEDVGPLVDENELNVSTENAMQDDNHNIQPDVDSRHEEELPHMPQNVSKEFHSMENSDTVEADDDKIQLSDDLLDAEELLKMKQNVQHNLNKSLVENSSKNHPVTDKNLKENKNMDSDDVPGTSRGSLKRKIRTRKMENDLERQKVKNQQFKERNRGKSKRMHAIEMAAKVISSCMPSHNFSHSVNLLKGYLLKLKWSTTLVPTYDDLAHDFCNNSKAVENYETWRISNDEFIDDVLFETNFNVITLEDSELNARQFFKYYKAAEVEHYFNIYKNSTELHERLRIQDFIMLTLYLRRGKYTNAKFKKVPRERLTAAFYRFALRECEEDWIENNMSIHQFHTVQSAYELYSNLSHESNYTFDNVLELFSLNRENEISKFDKINVSKKDSVIFDITFENQAGLVNVDRILGEYTGTYIILPSTTFPINMVEKILPMFISVKMSDKRLKEEKMIDIIKKLYNLLKHSKSLSRYYN